MRSELKWLLAIVAIIIILGVIVGCQQGTGASQPIRIGFNTWVGFGPFYIAQEKGFFTKRGLNVELQRIEGTGDRRSALIAGRLEGMGSTVDDLIIGAAQGVQGKMVLGIDESAGADGILTTKDINSVKDFKGKSIAVQPGFVNHFFLLYILDANGLSSKDVTIVPMEPDKASAAFVANEVDIAVTWEPHLSEVEKNRPDGKRFLTTNDYPGIIVDILVFSNDMVANRPNDVRAFVDAWYEAVDYLKANPEEGNAIIAKAMDLAPADVGGMLSGVKFLSKEDNAKYHDKAEQVNVFSIAAIAAKLWQAEGFIDKPVEVDSLIDASFLQGSGQ
jgi:NitT/TauT family transport system substrate-binding protein